MKYHFFLCIQKSSATQCGIVCRSKLIGNAPLTLWTHPSLLASHVNGDPGDNAGWQELLNAKETTAGCPQKIGKSHHVLCVSNSPIVKLLEWLFRFPFLFCSFLSRWFLHYTSSHSCDGTWVGQNYFKLARQLYDLLNVFKVFFFFLHCANVVFPQEWQNWGDKPTLSNLIHKVSALQSTSFFFSPFSFVPS